MNQSARRARERVMIDLKLNTEHGFLHGSPRDRVFELLVLHVDDAHHNCGIGTTLLRALSKWCIDRGIRRINVDDMSVRHRQPHNIYIVCGFSYRNSTGPEMYANPKMVERHTRRASNYIDYHRLH